MKVSPNVILFTRIKQWYLPLNVEAYNVLRDAKFPLLRFHINLLPTLKLALNARNVRGRLVPFKEQILNPFLERVGGQWQSKQHRRCTITATTMIFTSSKELETSKKAITGLEGALRRFFTRWGYTATFEYSELRGKCKLHVAYKFDSNRMPVLQLAEDPEAIPTVRFKIGHLRYSYQLGQKYIDTVIEEQAGPSWIKVKTSRCLYSQIGSIMPMLQVLADIANKDEYNLDNANE